MLNVRSLKVKDTLPNKLSGLLDLAIRDTEVLSDNPKYKFDMEMVGWYDDKSIREYCLICFAGAVMANTLHAPKDRYVSPMEYEDPKIDDKLRAIGKLGGLFVIDAFCTLTRCGLQGFYNAVLKVDFDIKLDKIIIQYINETSDVECVGDIINNANQHLDFYREFSGLLKEMGI